MEGATQQCLESSQFLRIVLGITVMSRCCSSQLWLIGCFMDKKSPVLPDAVFDKEMSSFTALVFLQKEAAPSLSPGDSDVLAD